MPYWSVTFFLIALFAALVGVEGITAGTASTGTAAYFIPLVLFIISTIAGLNRRRDNSP